MFFKAGRLIDNWNSNYPLRQCNDKRPWTAGRARRARQTDPRDSIALNVEGCRRPAAAAAEPVRDRDYILRAVASVTSLTVIEDASDAELLSDFLRSNFPEIFNR